MRSALIIGQTPPPYNGSSKMALRLSEALDSIGLDVKVISKNFSQSTGEIGRSYLAKMFKVPSLLWRINSALKAKPEFVVLFLTSRIPSIFLDLAVFWLCVLRRANVVLYIHTFGFQKISDKRLGISIILKRTFQFASAVVVLGSKMSDEIIEIQPKTKIRVIPNFAIPTASLAKNYVSKPKRTQLTFVSNLMESKGLDTFIEVFNSLAEKDHLLRANVVGELTYKNQISDVLKPIENSRISERIKFWGFQEETVINNIFDESLLLLYPSRDDAQPLVILEAMRSGLPVVASKVGTIPEMLCFDPRQLFEPRDIDGMKEACRAIISNSVLWLEISTNQIQVSKKKYSESAYRSNWGSLISDLSEK